MKRILSLLCLCMVLFSCGNKPKKEAISPELSDKIQSDERMKIVRSKAEELITKGLNAGDGYVEVWIRDLNTFIEAACHVTDRNTIRESLITFFKFQGKDGNIPDGYATRNEAFVPYNFIHSDSEPRYIAHKNTVETDQESSLIQAISKYIRATSDRSILDETVDGQTVSQRMGNALKFLINHRYNEEYGLIWGATTSDWGDVQPEHDWGVELDGNSHLSIDIYDNAMFIIAIENHIDMLNENDDIEYWTQTLANIKSNTRKHLWNETNRKFIPHIYLTDSPFPSDFDEDRIYYHGGTTIAIEAGLLSKEEIAAVYKQMKENVKAAGAQSVGLTVYPPYPNGFFKNPGMGEYSYQNGGDWTWFGGRTVQELIRNGLYEEAYEAISPMLDRVIAHDGFFEWWSPEGNPHGSSSFRGSAGVLWKAIRMFEEETLNQQ